MLSPIDAGQTGKLVDKTSEFLTGADQRPPMACAVYIPRCVNRENARLTIDIHHLHRVPGQPE